MESRKPGVCFHSHECSSWLKVYWWVYPKEDLLKIKLTPNLHIFTGCFKLCHLEEAGNRSISKGNWPHRSWFRSLVVKQNKVSQEGPRNVFSLTRLEWLCSCLSAVFAVLNRECQHVLASSAIPTYIPVMYWWCYFSQETVPLCTGATSQGELSSSHQGPVQHNRTPSFSYTAPYHSGFHGSQMASADTDWLGLWRPWENRLWRLTSSPWSGHRSSCHSVPGQTQYAQSDVSVTEKVRKSVLIKRIWFS